MITREFIQGTIEQMYKQRQELIEQVLRLDGAINLANALLQEEAKREQPDQPAPEV